MDTVDLPKVVAATAGLVGADLKRLVDDGKNLLVAEVVANRRPKPLTDHLLAAVAELRANKERYAVADQEARKQRPQRPVYFDAAVG
jgi:hypothetical protein